MINLVNNPWSEYAFSVFFTILPLIQVSESIQMHLSILMFPLPPVRKARCVHSSVLLFLLTLVLYSSKVVQKIETILCVGKIDEDIDTTSYAPC